MKIGKHEIREIRKAIAAAVVVVILIFAPKLLQDGMLVNALLMLAGIGGTWAVYRVPNDPPKSDG